MNREGILKHRDVFNKWLEGVEVEVRDPGTIRDSLVRRPHSKSSK